MPTDPYKHLEDAANFRLDANYAADKMTIRDFYSLQRRLFPNGPVQGQRENNGPLPSSRIAVPASGNEEMSARVKANVEAFMAEVDVWPTEHFTFPNVNRKLEEKGKKMSADQLRTVWDKIVGKRIQLVSERRGSVAAVFKRISDNEVGPEEET